MKLWDIAKNLGSAALQVALPGAASAIIAGVNVFLSDDEQLPVTATGHDVTNAIAKLPPEQQASVMEKEFDVDITQIKEANSTVRVMLESDVKNPHTTRPKIALQAFYVVAYADILAISIWAWAVVTSQNPLKNLTDGWPFILAVTGTLVTLLLAYFGVLKQEHKNKLDAANGSSTPTGIAGILSTLIKRR